MTREPASVAETVFDVIKSRRVTRTFTAEPVADDHLARLVAAARWASSAGNRHLHKFFITRDQAKIDLVRAFSPGMLTSPPALILILTDRDVAVRERLQDGDDANFVDVGTAAQNMMVMAHALGLGSCPVTSFSKSGVAGVLGLPKSLTPDLMLILGRPQPVARVVSAAAPPPVKARDLTFWEEVGRHEPD